jgi:hypothetical protein
MRFAGRAPKKVTYELMYRKSIDRRPLDFLSTAKKLLGAVRSPKAFPDKAFTFESTPLPVVRESL